MKKIYLLTALMALPAIAPQGAVAGFYMEGLQPYGETYCEGSKKGTDDPFIAPPADAWERTSPDASTLGGQAPWDAEDCATGKTPGKAGRGGRIHRAPSDTPVPQK